MVIDGALVVPSDVLVVDDDGIVVVPRQHVKEVAQCARKALGGDKGGRRRLYEQLGMPLDGSVK